MFMCSFSLFPLKYRFVLRLSKYFYCDIRCAGQIIAELFLAVPLKLLLFSSEYG